MSLDMRVLSALVACVCLISPVSALGSLSLLTGSWSSRKAPVHRYNTASELKARRHFELPPPQVLHALRIEEASPQLHELVSQVAVDLLPFEHGITLAMVEQAYCTGHLPGMRVQIIDQQVYVVGEVLADHSVHSRHHNLKAQLMALAASVELPDIDAVFTTVDRVDADQQQSTCLERGPLFSQARHPSLPHLIAYPDFTFEDWPEANIPSWEVQGYIMRKAAERTQWQARNPQLFFRGGLHPGQRGVVEGVDWQPLAKHFDVTFFSSPHDMGTVRSGFIPLPQHCDWKYLLNWPPQSSYSAHLKSLLSCGSAVVSAGAESGWHEFWYHLLKHNENIVLIPQIESAKDIVETLSLTVHDLKANDTGAQHIGEAGQRLIYSVLTPINVRLYWYSLLHHYSSLQRFKPTQDPDALVIGDSMQRPASEQPKARVCSLCTEIASSNEAV